MIKDASTRARVNKMFLVFITSSCHEDGARNCFIPPQSKARERERSNPNSTAIAMSALEQKLEAESAFPRARVQVLAHRRRRCADFARIPLAGPAGFSTKPGVTNRHFAQW